MHRSVVVQRRDDISPHLAQTELPWTPQSVAMDDRDDETELIALLVLREDRLHDRAAVNVWMRRGDTA